MSSRSKTTTLVPMSTQEQVSENVETLLRRLGMEKQELADAIHIHRVSVSHRLTGRTSWRTEELDALARVLSVTVAELVGTIPGPAEWQRRREPAAIPAGPGPRFLVGIDPYDGLNYAKPLDITGTDCRLSALDEQPALATCAPLPVLVRTGHNDPRAIPHAPHGVDLDPARLCQRVPGLVARQRGATTQRPHVTTVSRLPTHAQRRRDLAPRRTARACRRHVLDRRTLQLHRRGHYSPQFV